MSGAAPVVDVQQASRTQVLTRDLVDMLPTSRNIMSVGSVVPGLRAVDAGRRGHAGHGAALGCGGTARATCTTRSSPTA